MSRKGNIPKREVLPDPVYGSVAVAKLINSIMLDGKKGVAQNIVYGAFDMIQAQTGEEPLEVFENNLRKKGIDTSFLDIYRIKLPKCLAA